MKIPTKTVANPGLVDVLVSLKRDIFRSLNCIKVGKVDKFNADDKTAEIRILFKREVGDRVISVPLLVDCPVFTLQGGGAALQMPVAKGDDCIVLFSDRSLDTWFQTGSESVPDSLRCHDLSDGIALVGINSLTSSLASYPASTVQLSYGTAKIGLKGSKANIQNATYNLLDALVNLINGIQGATCVNGAPPTDTTGKIATSLTQIQGLLYKD